MTTHILIALSSFIVGIVASPALARAARPYLSRWFFGR